MMSYPYSPATGAGQEVPEPPKNTPKPEAKPPIEGAPSYVGHARTGGELPPCGPGLLAPEFARFAESLDAGLAADEAIRRRSVREALGPTDDERLRMHREMLAERVREGDITNAEANALFERAHPGIDPATLRPRSGDAK
jgi:hypothetical protein